MLQPFFVMRNTLAIVALAVVGAACAFAAIPEAGEDFDFYLLAQIWPGAQKKTVYPSYIDGFTVHGLWPNYADGSWPE